MFAVLKNLSYYKESDDLITTNKGHQSSSSNTKKYFDNANEKKSRPVRALTAQTKLDLIFVIDGL